MRGWHLALRPDRPSSRPPPKRRASLRSHRAVIPRAKLRAREPPSLPLLPLRATPTAHPSHMLDLFHPQGVCAMIFSTMPHPRLVSFIIPAWNEESFVATTIEAVKAAALDLAEPSEIIVADDASTDRTAEIARQHGARVVTVHHRQIAATRNAGAREAQGDLLIFIDADTIVTPEAVCAAVKAVRLGAIGGGCAIRYGGRLPLYLRVFVPIEVWFCRATGIAFGCFLFCTRAAFDAVGGFDTGLYATEEVPMSMALHRQGRFVILRECIITSGRKLRTHSTREWFGQIYRITFARRRYIRSRAGMGLWYDDRRPDPEMKKL